MTHYTKKQLMAVEKRLNSMYNEHSYFGMITITSRLDEKKKTNRYWLLPIK